MTLPTLTLSVCLMLATFGCALAQAADSSPVLTVRADEWYPVNGQPDADKPGFAIDILKAIFEPQGVAVDYRLSSWSRSLDLTRTGQVDCVVGAYHTDAPELAFPGMPMAFDDVAFYVTADADWHYGGPDSLDGVALGAIADYSYGRQLDAYLSEYVETGQIQKVHGLKPLERNIQKLLAGRIDVLITSPMVMEAMIAGTGLQDKVKQAGRAGLSEPVYLACAPGKPTTQEYLRLFDEGIMALRGTGELARIMARYGLPLPSLPSAVPR